jgi:hypothetical protein
MKRYLLITDSHAEEVERLIGIRGRDTPFGVLAEDPGRPVSVDAAVRAWDDWRSAQARKASGCICGVYAVMHHPRCPAGNAIF